MGFGNYEDYSIRRYEIIIQGNNKFVEVIRTDCEDMISILESEAKVRIEMLKRKNQSINYEYNIKYNVGK
ncbi:MAG: hypothetical protein AABX11_04205 [Nanoarchaeota archaeon]